MNRKKRITLLIFIIFILTSCTPAKEEYCDEKCSAQYLNTLEEKG